MKEKKVVKLIMMNFRLKKKKMEDIIAEKMKILFL